MVQANYFVFSFNRYDSRTTAISNTNNLQPEDLRNIFKKQQKKRTVIMITAIKITLTNIDIDT